MIAVMFRQSYNGNTLTLYEITVKLNDYEFFKKFIIRPAKGKISKSCKLLMRLLMMKGIKRLQCDLLVFDLTYLDCHHDFVLRPDFHDGFLL